MDDPADLPGLEDLAERLEVEYGAQNDLPGDRSGTRMRADLAAWARSLLARARTDETSLRKRFAALGDDYNREREARQALLWTAIDLKENAILEIEHAHGQRITLKRGWLPWLVEQGARDAMLAAEQLTLGLNPANWRTDHER